MVDETGDSMRLYNTENDEWVSEWVVDSSEKKSKYFKLKELFLSRINDWFELFSSEQAAYFVPIQIGNGHCIAGYVAWAKETVRIDNIESVGTKNLIWFINFLFIQLDTNKYPDGLYIKDDKVTTVMAHPIINASGTLLGINQFFFLFDHNQQKSFDRCGGILSSR